MLQIIIPLLQCEVKTTSLEGPTGVVVDTIRHVSSVRDLSWAEGSDYITVTTDDRVCTPHL